MTVSARDAERALIAADPAIPGLALILNPERLLAALRLLPRFTNARALKETYLRYKPGTSCLLAIEISLNDGSRQIWFAKALTRERFSVSATHPKRQALLDIKHPFSPVRLEKEAILLEHPTQDREIRYLDALWQESQRTTLLRQWLPEQADAPDVEWRFLRYKPERRCVAGITRAGKPLAVIRCASAREFGAILQGCATGLALGHVSLLGAWGKKRLVATRWVEGECLEHLLPSPAMPALLTRTGDALAQVHSAPFALPVKRSVEDDLQFMWRAIDTLRVVYPQAIPHFERCAGLVREQIRQFEQPATLLHGDFSADQVIIAGSDTPIHFIDWDRSTYGHPLNDLASFLARIEMDVIENSLSRAQADTARTALVSGYHSRRDLPVDGLPCYTALALLALVAEPFRKRADNWPAGIDALLRRAEQLLAPRHPVAEGDWQMRLSQICSRKLMEIPLRQALKLPTRARLHSCEVLRHKAGRRALVAYRWSIQGNETPLVVLGKYREKGADRHAFRCQRALWDEMGTRGRALCVPEPLSLLAECNMWLQRHVDAQMLTNCLSPSADLTATGTVAGTALAALQASPALKSAVSGRVWKKDDELQVLAHGLNQVAADNPHWQQRLMALLNACDRQASYLFRAAAVPVHRDFYPDQVLIDARGTPVLLDFDLCCMSAAALDAGNYLAHVRELALRRFGSIDALRPHEEAFIRAWLAHSPQSREADVAGFLALSLARHVYLSTRFPTRTHTTAALLEYCEQLIGMQ